MSARKSTTASAPGKVLVCGGYVVLDRPNPGLVVGVSARVHVTAEIAPLAPVRAEDPANGDYLSDPRCVAVSLFSPQYASRSLFLFCPGKGVCGAVGTGDDGDGASDHATPDAPVTTARNPFVENVVSMALLYAFDRGVVGPSAALDPSSSMLRITVRGDNQFYSQAARLAKEGLPLCAASLGKLPKFANFIDPSSQAKTGLGSSAALVAATCAAVLDCLGAVTVPRGGAAAAALPSGDDAGEVRAVVHAVSQLAHCAAQGKVGSGFDVCSAVYGTLEYVRFSPPLLREVLDAGTLATPAAVAACVAQPWDHRANPFQLPETFTVLVGDVSAGACTPSMVRSLLKWRDETGGEESAGLWPQLVRRHAEAAETLRALAAARDSPVDLGVACAREGFASDDGDSASVTRCLELLRAARGAYAELRKCVRTVSDLSGVPVEPRKLTPLLDATESVPGVLCAGCPGAGGEDAIFAMVVDPARVSDVETLWEGWAAQGGGVSVCALDLRAGDAGIRVEDGDGDGDGACAGGH